MQASNFWNKFYLHRAKIILLFCLVAEGSLQAQSFLWARKNNPNYDNRRLTYGFLIGLHTTSYQIKYSDKMLSNDLATLHSVIPEWRPGFSLGFIVNYRLAEFLDLRITPEVAFYEHKLQYRFTDKTSKEQLVETTMVELPLLLKYKSERRGNVRAYMIGGIKPGIDASGKKEGQNSKGLDIKNMNLNLEAGLGLDLYFPLFKFSPEIRFSRGIVNVFDNNTENEFTAPLKYINTNTITIYLLFQ